MVAATNWLKIKQEAADLETTDKEGKGKGKKVAKSVKAKSVLPPKPKRKVSFHESDSEKTPSPKKVKKLRTQKTKPSGSLHAFPSTFVPADLEIEQAVTSTTVADVTPVIADTTVTADIVMTAHEVGHTSEKASTSKPSSSVVAAPLQVITHLAELPPARPFGIMGKSDVELTFSGLDVLHGLHSPVDRTEGQGILTKEPHPTNAIQILVDIIMDSVNEVAEDQLKSFDEWMENRWMLVKRFRNKAVLDKAIALERSVMKAVKAVTVPQALEQ